MSASSRKIERLEDANAKLELAAGLMRLEIDAYRLHILVLVRRQGGDVHLTEAEAQGTFELIGEPTTEGMRYRVLERKA